MKRRRFRDRVNYRKYNGKERNKQKRYKLKAKTILLYGNFCMACQTKELSLLTIDHILNNGMAERRVINPSTAYSRYVKNKRSDLQCLCFNCNIGRKQAYGPDFNKWPKNAPSVKDILNKDIRPKHFTRLPKGTFKTKRAAHLAWSKRNSEYLKELRLRRKAKVMDMYGGQCSFCKTDELAVLSIDHERNNGKKDRLIAKGNAFYSKLLKYPKRKDLRCLCLNCNLRKTNVF